MKTINLTACIFFAIIAIFALIASIIEWRFCPMAIFVITGALSLVAYRDYKSPEQY